MTTLRVIIEMELPRSEARSTLEELESGVLTPLDLDFAPEEITYEITD